MYRQSHWFLAIGFWISAALGAQEARPFERQDGEPLAVDVRLLRVGLDGATQPVARDHVFAETDQVAMEIQASRGGYVRLAVEDPQAQDGLRPLWPADGQTHPVAARQATRLPTVEEAPLRLIGRSPTDLVVLFSPQPPAGQAGRKWLRQIDLREIGVAEAAAAPPPPIRFEGRVETGETVRMKITVHHESAGARDG